MFLFNTTYCFPLQEFPYLHDKYKFIFSIQCGFRETIVFYKGDDCLFGVSTFMFLLSENIFFLIFKMCDTQLGSEFEIFKVFNFKSDHIKCYYILL